MTGPKKTGASDGVAAPPGCPDQPGGMYRDGPGRLALFNQPTSVAINPAGELFVADSGNQVVRRIDPAGNVTLFAGSVGQVGNTDGRLADARFFFPVDLAFAPNGDLLMTEGSHVRRIAASGEVTTVAGSPGAGMDAAGYADGAGLEARFRFNSGIAIAVDGTMFTADTGNGRIRRISPGSFAVTTVAGRGGQGFAIGSASSAVFSEATGIVCLADGAILVSDYNLNRIFRIQRSAP